MAPVEPLTAFMYARGLMLDRKISRNFWQKKAANAADPRSVTLAGIGLPLAQRQVALFQSWVLRQLDAMGCTWQRVADMGCGNGDWTIALAQRASELYAVDGCAEFVDYCRERILSVAPEITLHMDVVELGALSLSDQYDLIMCGAVAQYLNEAELDHILDQFRNALAPGGILCFRTTVSRSAKAIYNRTNTYQAVYRPRRWYQERFASHGLDIRLQDVATHFVADELAHTLGVQPKLVQYAVKGLARGALGAYSIYESLDVWACFARQR